MCEHYEKFTIGSLFGIVRKGGNICIIYRKLFFFFCGLFFRLLWLLLLPLRFCNWRKMVHCDFCRLQDAEDQQVTSSGCHWVCRWQQLWTVLITLVQRTFTSFQWRESRVGSTGCHLLVLETWWWPLWRRESLISGRRLCPLSLWGSANPGAERMVSTCTLKVRILFSLCCLFVVSMVGLDVLLIV